MSAPISSTVTAGRNLNSEIQSVNPSALMTFFEIDLTEIALGKGLIASIDAAAQAKYIFRFHSNVILTQEEVIFQNKQYDPAPIKAEGFELNGRGTLPVPKLSITANSDGLDLMTLLKAEIATIGDLAGAKVTRIRTLAKFLDAVNSLGGANSSPDPNAEFPREVFFVDRKSLETKTSIEYELASILDIEGIQIPARIVSAKRCLHTYRGEGCLYERDDQRVESVHGEDGVTTLPVNAPPVANDRDELIKDGNEGLLGATISVTEMGEYDSSRTDYVIGNSVYTIKDGIKYQYVAKTSVPAFTLPPNTDYWIADACSKLVAGCNIRWGAGSPGKTDVNQPHAGHLPFGGFPSTNRFK